MRERERERENCTQRHILCLDLVVHVTDVRSYNFEDFGFGFAHFLIDFGLLGVKREKEENGEKKYNYCV